MGQEAGARKTERTMATLWISARVCEQLPIVTSKLKATVTGRCVAVRGNMLLMIDMTAQRWVVIRVGGMWGEEEEETV